MNIPKLTPNTGNDHSLSNGAGSGMKLSPSKAGTNYTSPNYFMEMASEHMNAKVSPYLAFLSTVRTKLPAVERLVLGEGGFTNDTSTTYLDKNGDVVKRKDLSKQQKTLLKEYRLIQYDMTAGKVISPIPISSMYRTHSIGKKASSRSSVHDRIT